MTRKDRRERAELKKEEVRKEIFKILCAAEKVKNLDRDNVINTAIEELKRGNPQEAHFVSTVCSEIRQDVTKFTKDMISKHPELI